MCTYAVKSPCDSYLVKRSEWKRELSLRLCAWCRQPVAESNGVYHAAYRILTHQGECEQHVANYEIAYDRSPRGRNRTPRELLALIAVNRPPTMVERFVGMAV